MAGGGEVGANYNVTLFPIQVACMYAGAYSYSYSLHAVEVGLTFRLDPNIINLSYAITCTVTGGTVLTGSFTGYLTHFLRPPSAVLCN